LIVKWSWWGCDRIAAGSAYLSALREGAARIGPDGQRTGLVNAEEEKFAAAQLAEKVARAKNRRLFSATPTAKPTLIVTVSTL
jgi:sRNA-binding protein